MFTARVQYALVLLHEIRTCGTTSPISLKEICAKYSLKQEFLVQTARKLRIAGYIMSIKGPGGGYIAAMDLAEIDFVKLYKDMQPSTSALKVTDCNEVAEAIIREAYRKFEEKLDAFKV